MYLIYIGNPCKRIIVLAFVYKFYFRFTNTKNDEEALIIFYSRTELKPRKILKDLSSVPIKTAFKTLKFNQY